MLSDVDSAGLEAWVVAARTYAESSQNFVTASSDLSIVSRDTADIIQRLYGNGRTKPRAEWPARQGPA